MFDSLRLLSPTKRDIILHTRTRREIPNEIGCEPTPQHILKFDTLCKRHSAWVLRKPATGGYNCAGHVWASRRTCIYDDFEKNVQYILKDDGYRCLGQGEAYRTVVVGDVVLYWEVSVPPKTTLLHVGVVSEMREGVSLQSPRIPFVLSKWDDTSGEVLHHYNIVPFQEGEYVAEFWTDRPDTTEVRP